ncbi:MAG: hypothetical protein IT193_16765 [Propionibacteriaceae bacterium]|nr:hypothetical protein [Propionibacteriaceae bacterium]
MVDDGERAEAELAYQRALTSLHEARAALEDLAAARRRFAFDRGRMGADAAAARAAELEASHASLLAHADQLRDLAAGLRSTLRRLTDDTAPEPDDLPEEPAGGDYEQPPFAEQVP